MNTKYIAILACLVTNVGLVTPAGASGETGDPILASFERAFRHTVVDTEVVTGTAIDEDILYRQINAPLWTLHKHDDPVWKSFQRALAHQGVETEVVTGQAVEQDVLYRLVGEALRD